MKNFNIKRFGQTLKWTLLTEKNSILTAAVAFLTAFLVIQLFNSFTILDLTHSLEPAATVPGVAACVALLSFMLSYYATGLLGNARTAQQRAVALMLPASNAEKFAVRLVYCCVIMPLLLVVALLGATALRMLLEFVFGHECIISGLSDMVEELKPVITLDTFILSLSSLSFGILGGVFFRHRPFIMLFVTSVLGALVLITLFFYLGMMIGEEKIRRFFDFFADMSFDTLKLCGRLLLIAVTVFNLWLSYWLFCRLQVVQHKWFNV